jgi:hypothetical protein
VGIKAGWGRGVLEGVPCPGKSRQVCHHAAADCWGGQLAVACIWCLKGEQAGLFDDVQSRTAFATGSFVSDAQCTPVKMTVSLVFAI